MGVVQGSGIDADLNELGNRQAQAFFEHYQDLALDKIYTSALRRTHQSVKGFIDKGLPWEQYEGLNEISWGEYEGTPMTPEEGEYYRMMLHQWQEGNLDYAIAGGESPNLVAERLHRAIQIILNGSGATILVCMHGRAMRIFLSLICQTPLKEMDQYEHGNLCLYLLQQQEGGGFTLLQENDQAHLKGLKQI